jgi:hypothetical protein
MDGGVKVILVRSQYVGVVGGQFCIELECELRRCWTWQGLRQDIFDDPN